MSLSVIVYLYLQCHIIDTYNKNWWLHVTCRFSFILQKRRRIGGKVVRTLARAVHNRGLHRRRLSFAVQGTGIQACGGHKKSDRRRCRLRELHGSPTERRHGRHHPIGNQRHLAAADWPRVHRNVRDVFEHVARLQ